MNKEQALEEELLYVYEDEDVFCDFLHNEAKDGEWCAAHCSFTTPDAVCLRRYLSKKYDIT